MRKFSIITLIFVLGLFTWNCSKQTEVVESEYEFTEIEIPVKLKLNFKTFADVETFEDDIVFKTKAGKEVYGKIRISFYADQINCNVLKIELSKKLLEETGLSKDFFKNYYSMKSTNDVADCFVKCEDATRGRFWCKATCIIVAIIDAAVPH